MHNCSCILGLLRWSVFLIWLMGNNICNGAGIKQNMDRTRLGGDVKGRAEVGSGVNKTPSITNQLGTSSN
jgi:hypothetical protein